VIKPSKTSEDTAVLRTPKMFKYKESVTAALVLSGLFVWFFVWQESLFYKNFNPKCVARVSPSQQLEQNSCSELIPFMGNAVQK
jgi:hypothetical protein